MILKEEEMNEKLNIIQLGALLHDIGKIVRRAGESNLKHQEAGANFLKKNELLLNEYKEIYDIVKYHHAKELKSANLPESSLAYIVYEADNISSGIDRVKYDDDKPIGNEMLPLNSVFNRVKMDKISKEKVFSLVDVTSKEEIFNMPKEKKENEKLDKTDYLRVLNNLKENIKDMKENLLPERLMTVLEENCIYFPSSAYVDYPDISYYDHVKLTAAVASCLYLYDIENNIENYKQEYFGNKELRNKEKFLFVSGEFTGIQNFIYTITSKMAMKSLRGRSFYLELFIEHIIDEILSALELSRMNLIYSGGSQFYLLLPNIEKSRKVLENYKERINDFLLKEIGSGIYYEMSFISVSAEDLGNGLSKEKKTENRVGEIFRKTSISTSKSKLNRYSVQQLEKLFDENSEINKIHDSTKECKICKKSEEKSILEHNSEQNVGNIEICNACKNYIELGKNISRLYHSEKDVFIAEIPIVEKNIKNHVNSLIFPKYTDGYVSVEFLKKDKIEKELKEGNIYRFYAVNSYYSGNGLPKNIRIGNYNIRSEKDDKNKLQGLIEFTELVEKAKGIERLAVFRADVDNLGTLFQSGFVDKNSTDNKYKYVTLSKSVVLSRYLSDFFKRKINLILEKKNAAKEKNEYFKRYCDIINNNNDKPRNIVVVYSGGDDIFAIGTWNDIIEFSVDLRTAFKEFTNGKITMSAGIGFFSKNFPVYQMAERTGELEKMAKSYSKENSEVPTKDAVALFGVINNELNHVYDWDTFIDKVLNEKYAYLKSAVIFEENNNSDKIFVGKSKWYSLMNLIENRLECEDNRMDIARFAYTLARIKNNTKNKDNYLKFKEKLFNWIKNKEDAKHLLTAINVIIYEERGE